MSPIDAWITVTIDECCEILDSKRIPVNAEQREIRQGNVPYYGANGLQGYIDDYIFNEDLILIAEDGGNFDQFAIRPIAYRVGGRSWVNNHAHVLRAKSDYCQDAIFYSLEHKDIQSFILGGTRSKLNQSHLRSITIRLPDSKEEQTQIAAILSTIDKAVAQTEAIIAKQQRIKTGLMQDLLTRGIDEHGNLRSEDTHAFKDSPLGRIPVEWEVTPAFALCRAVIDCKNRTPPQRHEGYPVIRTPNVRDGVFVYEDLDFTDLDSYEIWTSRGKPNPGDVVITREAPFGEACIIPNNMPHTCLGQRMMMYKPDENKLNNRYLVHAVYSDKVKSLIFALAGGSTVGHLRVDDVRFLSIPHPKSIKEQFAIANTLDAIATGISDAAFVLKKLRHQKTALMQDLLTGKVRVTDLLEASGA